MTATPLRVLLVWDDEDDDLRVRDRLAEDYPALALEWAHTCAAGLAALARRAHNIALVADRLGTRSEPDLLREARGTAPLGPAIILTGAGDAAVAAGAAVASGVLDTRHLDTPSLVSAIRAARGQAELAAARDVLGATLDGAGIILAVNAVWRCFAAANGLRAASQAIRGTITWPSATPPPGMPMRRRWPRPSAPSWRGPARPSPGNTPATPPTGGAGSPSVSPPAWGRAPGGQWSPTRTSPPADSPRSGPPSGRSCSTGSPRRSSPPTRRGW